MGTIKVGKSSPSLYNPDVTKRVDVVSSAMSDEQKACLIDSIMQMPVEKRVSALRSAGLSSEADDYERVLAEEHLREMELRDTGERLMEISDVSYVEQLQPVEPVVVSEEVADVLKKSVTKRRGGRRSKKQ